MNAAPSIPRARRHGWLWIGLGLFLAPFVALAVFAVNLLTLNREADALREEVMKATSGEWKQRIQLSAGGLTLATVRTGLKLVDHAKTAEAEAVIGAIRRASVGVYERAEGGAQESRAELFNATDAAMDRRQWMRLVGVADEASTVLIYVPAAASNDEIIELCLAVVESNTLVVVSARVDAERLAEFAGQYAFPEKWSGAKLARLR